MTTALISEAFASALRSGRAELNARFTEARRLRPDLDPTAFSSFLRRAVDPVARAVQAAQPQHTAEVVSAAYEIALDLVGQRLAGAGARQQTIEDGWRLVLPTVGPLVASAPRAMLTAMSNALHHLASTPGARPEQWIENLARLGPQCRDVPEWLRLGQVLAWRAGLAHFRNGALAEADRLPAALALAAVGAAADRDWCKLRDCLLQDPWFDPARSEEPAASGRIALVAGAFRGFGGLFAEPPKIARAREHFLVASGGDCWLLTADRFGATFHRAEPAQFEEARQSAVWPEGLHVSSKGVSWKGNALALPDLGEFSSIAANGTTLAVTSPLTFAVTLIELAWGLTA